MKRGYIEIRCNSNDTLVVNACFINGTLWMTVYEMADLFNTFTSSVNNNLMAAYKSGILQKENVTQIYENGNAHIILYNLEALIFIAYRTASKEAEIFRQWLVNTLYKCHRDKQNNVWFHLPLSGFANNDSSIALN